MSAQKKRAIVAAVRTPYLCSTLLLGALAVGPGCRYGFELLAQSGLEGPVPGNGDGDLGGGPGDGDTSAGDGDLGGSPGDGDSDMGGGSPGGSQGDGDGDGDGDSGTGGTTAILGDLHVDSAEDISEAGKLTLREAITQANAQMGTQTITFEPGLTIEAASPMPEFRESTIVIGNGTHVNFSSYAGTQPCLNVFLGVAVLTMSQMRISNCDGVPLRLEGGVGHELTDNIFEDNAGSLTVDAFALNARLGPGNLFLRGANSAIVLNATAVVIEGNTFVDVGGGGGAAVFLNNGASGANIIGNVMIRPRNGIVFSATSINVGIFHNTIAGALSNAVLANVGGGTTVENNIITHSGASGIVGDTGTLLSWDYNLFFANAAHCSGCTGGLGANAVISDPLYIDYAGDNVALQNGSPAIDEGTDRWGFDRNDGSPGDFYGAAPDMGAFETNY